MKKYKVLDLFAGAGGLSLGFNQTGRFETAMAIEINKSAAETYIYNHKIEVINEDIRNINFKDHQKYPNLKNVSVVIGGPPCQGFSNANRQKSELFSNNNLLVKEYVRAIKEIQPKAFIMENVKTINSNKHKFFVTNGEIKDLELKGIEVKSEDLFIGNVPEYNEILVTLFNSRRITTPLMENNLYTKFKSLIRYFKKHKSLHHFFEKNFNFFKRFVNNWGKYFNSYYNTEIQYLINNVKNNVQSILNNGNYDLAFMTQIYQLTEIHNITLIFKEIIEKNIESSNALIKKEKGILVKGTTYTVIDYLLKTFSSLGYQLDHGVLNAAHFGVPQERNRFFIIGIKDIKPSLPDSILTQDEFFNIGHALKDLEDIRPSFQMSADYIVKKPRTYINSTHPLSQYLNANTDFLFNHIVTETTETALKRFKALEPGQNFHDLDDSLKTTYSDIERTQNTIYKRLDYANVCNTVVNVRKSMWIHPVKNRAISIREAARLQSFPDNYVFIGNKNSQYQQIGNAVPPLLGRAVAEKLLSCLKEKPLVPLKILFNKELEEKKEAVPLN